MATVSSPKGRRSRLGDSEKLDPHQPQTVGAWCYIRIVQDSQGRLSIDALGADQGEINLIEPKGEGVEDWWVLESYIEFQTSRPKPLKLSPADTPAAAVIVETPASWTPTSPADVPPNVELRIEPSAVEASEFAKGFNQAEINDPKGHWCIAPATETEGGAK